MAAAWREDLELPVPTSVLAAFQDDTCENGSGFSRPASNLESAVLRKADLGGANLSFSTLLGAILSGADLTSVNFSFASLTGATYDEGTRFPSGSAYGVPSWGLPGGISPWNAGMIPTPEPSVAIQVFLGAIEIAGLAVRGRVRRASRWSPARSECPPFDA